jgi:hypothetical protein
MGDEIEKNMHIESGGRYWVIPGRLLAGPYPVSSDEIAQRNATEILFLNGISHLVDLTQENEIAPSYADVIKGLAASHSGLVRYTRFSIPDMAIPPKFWMKKILDHIDACLAHEEILYLHCMGGLGRTGTVVGCHLVRHGLTGEEALDRLEFLRRNTHNYWRSSPETEAQHQFILDWAE